MPLNLISSREGFSLHLGVRLAASDLCEPPISPHGAAVQVL